MLARTARGAGWVIAWRLATRLLGVASTLFTVRLLTPADFGLVALAYGFAAALDVALTLGVEDQIIRARAPDRALYDTAFTLNLLRGMLVACMVVAAAGPTAAFFGDARLEPALLVLAADPLLRGLFNVGATEFRRDLAFDKEFRLMLLPKLAGVAVIVSLAFLLRSHWALIIGILTSRVASVAASYLLHPYRPRLSFEAWRELAGVSAWSWGLGMVALAREWAPNVVIGRVMGPTQVGVFTVAEELATIPTNEFVDPLCRSCMPGFAEMRRTGTGVADAYLSIIAMTAVLALPIGTGISLVAGPLVALVFGQAWLEAVPVMAVLGLACGLTLFGNVSGALLSAHALLRSLLAIGMAAILIRIALLLALVPPFGLWGAGLAVAVSILAEQAALVWRTLREFGLGPLEWLRCTWRPLTAAAVMALALFWTGLGWALPPASTAAALLPLTAGVLLGAATYVAGLGALWLACGRPAGPESLVLGLAWRVAGAVAGRIRRAAPRGWSPRGS